MKKLDVFNLYHILVFKFLLLTLHFNILEK